MISVVRIGVRNVEAAKKFYDELFALVGASAVKTAEDGSFVVYSSGEGPSFIIGAPRNGKPPTSNGLTIGVTAQNPAAVKSLHEKALTLGATDEGAPGARFDGAVFCGYVRDPDGNKLNFICAANE